MQFQTNRLRVREFTQADVIDIHRIATSPSFVFYNLDGSHDASKRFVDRAIEKQTQTSRDSFKMAVEDISRPDHCIGYVSIDDIAADKQGAPDVGYIIDPREQGKGFATEAMIGLMHAAFHHHPSVNQVWLTAHPDNKASQGVARKLTFDYVGDKEIETAHGTEPRLVYLTDQERFSTRYGTMDALMEM